MPSDTDPAESNAKTSDRSGATDSPLRTVLTATIRRQLGSATRRMLPSLCDQLELPPAPDDETLSKAEYVESRLALMPPVPLEIANAFLVRHPPSGSDAATLRIEDEIFRAIGGLVIPMRERREMARAILPDDLFLQANAFMRVLDRHFVLESTTNPFAGLFGTRAPTLRDEIQRHVIRNPGDWTVEELFDKLGAFATTDRRFAKFVEALTSHTLRPDEASQRLLVTKMNAALVGSDLALREVGEDGGYPVFELVSAGGLKGRPKNIIFATLEKPDLRFTNALENEIELLSSSDRVLLFDRTIPSQGLRWNDLQAWWCETTGLRGRVAKKALFERLRACLPEKKVSPPQRLFFEAYHKHFGPAVPELPALLPEVWLLFDPYTAKVRGRQAFVHQRMDFVLLISARVRVVIEVDGLQHYAGANAHEARTKYASAMSADRDLLLRGYEVYRFGGIELVGEEGHRRVGEFFNRLFERHGVKVARTS